MKYIYIFLLAVLFSLPVFSQSSYNIRGKVIDESTRLPLQGASVFAENTTIGTATDNDGIFHLALPNGGYSIVITYTGYQTETKRVTTADAAGNEMVFEIRKKEKSLEEFVVRSTSEVADGLEKYGEFFMENFIGKTPNGKQCVIKNREALKFYYYRRTKRLKILATEPLEIVNEALGYNIKYELDSFVHEYNTQVSLYTGYPLFREMEGSSAEQREKWKAARKVAYNGSILHFMRSMHQKKLKEAGFEIQFLVTRNNKETAIPLKDFYGAVNYRMDDSSNTAEILPRQKEMAVIFKNEEPGASYLGANPDLSSRFQLSVVSFLPGESLEIEQNGFYFEQHDITINGYWAWEKVGDMLPYDFRENEYAAELNKQNETGYAPGKPVTEQKEPLREETKPVNSKPADKNDPLTANSWQMQESRVIEGNNMFYYKRNAAENTINFDNDMYTFNSSESGIYTFNGQQYNFNWKYLDEEKTRMEIVILYPVPLIVNLENITLTSTIFKYTRLQKVNGLLYVAIETRTVK